MSRVLKVIVNVVLLCALLSAAALLVPSLLGVEMNIIENDRVETNLSVGSVVYGKTKDLKDVKFGDEVFVSESDGSKYLYRVNAVDAENGTVVLKDAKNDAADTVEKEASSLCVAIVTVPLLGYLAAAASTPKGWIIIGLVALLLLLLFVLSEIWRKDKLREEEEDDEDGDADELEEAREEKKRRRKEKKAQKKAARYADEEDDDEEYEEYLKKKKEKKAAKRARKAAKKEARRISEEPMAMTKAIEAEPETEEPVQNTADLFEAARMEIASSVTSAMAEDQNPAETPEQTEIDLEAALTQELAKAASDAVQEREKEQAEAATAAEEEPEDSQEIVMPSCTADELIRKAIMAGDEPDIVEDKDLGLTLLDYTDCL